MFGRLFAAPLRLLNAPIRAAENLLSDGDCPECERLLSKPLDAVADEVEEAIDGDED